MPKGCQGRSSTLPESSSHSGSDGLRPSLRGGRQTRRTAAEDLILWAATPKGRTAVEPQTRMARPRIPTAAEGLILSDRDGLC